MYWTIINHIKKNIKFPLNLFNLHHQPFKGEVQSWSNLISEERVKFSEQNSENLMKIGWKIRKLWNFFKFHKFSGNISWPVRMNMQMSELMMSSPHYLPYILYIKFWKFLFFAPTFDSYVTHTKIYWC